MRHSVALLLMLLMVPAAQAQAPERWFAIAWEGNARQHLGPFPSLEACEAGRMNPGGARAEWSRMFREAETKVAAPEMPPPNATEAQTDAYRRAQGRTLDQIRQWMPEGSERLLRTFDFWEKKAICERK